MREFMSQAQGKGLTKAPQERDSTFGDYRTKEADAGD